MTEVSQKQGHLVQKSPKMTEVSQKQGHLVHFKQNIGPLPSATGAPATTARTARTARSTSGATASAGIVRQ